MPKIPFLNDANIILYLLYPIPYLKQYQNNNARTRTNNTIIGNSTRLLFAVPLALNTLSMGARPAGTNVCAVITSLVNNVSIYSPGTHSQVTTFKSHLEESFSPWLCCQLNTQLGLFVSFYFQLLKIAF